MVVLYVGIPKSPVCKWWQFIDSLCSCRYLHSEYSRLETDTNPRVPWFANRLWFSPLARYSFSSLESVVSVLAFEHCSMQRAINCVLSVDRHGQILLAPSQVHLKQLFVVAGAAAISDVRLEETWGPHNDASYGWMVVSCPSNGRCPQHCKAKGSCPPFCGWMRLQGSSMLFSGGVLAIDT